MKVLLACGGHFSSCPRLLKEASALQKEGIHFSMLGAGSIPQLEERDRLLLSENVWKGRLLNWNEVGWMHKAEWKWSQQRARKKILSGKYDPLSGWSAYPFWSRKYLEEFRREKPDWIVARHIPLLPVVVRYAGESGCKVAFDVEDYHPGEHPDPQSEQNRLAHAVMQNHLSKVHRISAASPGIAEAIQREFGVKGVTVVLNAFPKQSIEPLPYKDRKGEAMSIYWMSQTIGLDRGLEDIFRACGKLRGDFQIHLRGTYSEPVRHQIQKWAWEGGFAERCFVHDQVDVGELWNRTCEHDVGLAAEQKIPLNHDLCISNKILYYPMAGLAVVASRTQGQDWVMEQSPGMGFSYNSGDVEAIVEGLQYWLENPEELRQIRMTARKIAEEKWNWETESQKFLQTILN